MDLAAAALGSPGLESLEFWQDFGFKAMGRELRDSLPLRQDRLVFLTLSGPRVWYASSWGVGISIGIRLVLFRFGRHLQMIGSSIHLSL